MASSPENEDVGLADIQAKLLADRNKLLAELEMDGGLQSEQRAMADSAKIARKRGVSKKDKAPADGPVMARRSLR